MAAKDRTILRMAAIAAVLAELAQQSEDVSLVARQPGLAWSQDHRRMNTGQSGLMHQRASRSPWK